MNSKTESDLKREYEEYIYFKATEYLDVQDDEFCVFDVARREEYWKSKLSFERYKEGYRL